MVSRSTLIVFLLLAILSGNVIALVSGAQDLDRTPALRQAVHRLAVELDRRAVGMGMQSSLPPHGSPVLGRVSSRFGMRLHPRYKRWRPHRGVDIAVPVGTPVMATADGWVARVATDPTGYGLFMDVVHPASGFLTRFAHLSSARFQSGRAVRRGDVIALSGDSGNAMGAHLHYEVRYRGRAVDPMRIVVGTKSEGR